MGLGSANDVPLADDRERAADARRLIARASTRLMTAGATPVFRSFGALADDVCETLAESRLM
jgi:hypothetical protein